MKIEHLNKNYGAKKVVTDLSVAITPQKFTAFIGPNGAGKSTLLAMIARLLKKDFGEVYLSGQGIESFKATEFAKKISILKQQNHLDLKISVRELVAFGRFPYSKGHLKKSDQEKIAWALALMNLEELADQHVAELSGGQLQRAYIALVLAQDTDYILLDEPLNNLDIKHATQMMKNLQQLVTDYGKTVVMVVHDLNFAASYADEVVMMKNGKLFANGPTAAVMTQKSLSALYDTPIKVCEISGQRFCLYY